MSGHPTRFALAALVLLALVALLTPACGAQLEAEDRRKGSNFNPDDFKTREKKTVRIAPTTTDEPHQVRDPDGLLYRIDPAFHEQLAEIRLDDADQGYILLLFRGGEGIKLKPEDIDALQLMRIEEGQLVIKVREQEFRLKAFTG